MTRAVPARGKTRGARNIIDLKNLGKTLDKDVGAQAIARESEDGREMSLLLNQSADKEDSDF